MDDDELTEVLEDAGLSPYQSEAYVALLGLGTASATDIADACDVPDPRIYDVLRDLESKGYIETFQQDSLTARAHDPKDVLENLRSQSSRYLEAAEDIEERWNQPEITDHEVSTNSSRRPRTRSNSVSTPSSSRSSNRRWRPLTSVVSTSSSASVPTRRARYPTPRSSRGRVRRPGTGTSRRRSS